MFAAHLFHHPVGHVTEALLANWTGFEAFGFTRPADDVAFAALDDRRRDPVMAHWTVKVANQGVVINETAAGAQLVLARVRSARSGISGRRFPHAALASQGNRGRPGFAVTSSVGHRITTCHGTDGIETKNNRTAFDISLAVLYSIPLSSHSFKGTRTVA